MGKISFFKQLLNNSGDLQWKENSERKSATENNNFKNNNSRQR
jgi:hypothetical protein